MRNVDFNCIIYYFINFWVFFFSVLTESRISVTDGSQGFTNSAAITVINSQVVREIYSIVTLIELGWLQLDSRRLLRNGNRRLSPRSVKMQQLCKSNFTNLFDHIAAKLTKTKGEKLQTRSRKLVTRLDDHILTRRFASSTVHKTRHGRFVSIDQRITCNSAN